jgi:N-acylneuraminate cytidylyltransferase
MNEIRNAGIQMVVLSTESNPVVTARCKKIKVEVFQGIPDKAMVLKELLANRGINPHSVIYLGNDINDIACFPLVGCAIVTADAEPAALRMADVVLTRKGGQGVVRELCDLILEKYHPKE